MVVVKSPRSRDTLDRLLGRTNCVLAAEHGAFIRWGKHARWQVCSTVQYTTAVRDSCPDACCRVSLVCLSWCAAAPIAQAGERGVVVVGVVGDRVVMSVMFLVMVMLVVVVMVVASRKGRPDL